jgi:hypothetical protein
MHTEQAIDEHRCNLLRPTFMNSMVSGKGGRGAERESITESDEV